MGGSNVNYLTFIGLTNKHSESLGNIAGSFEFPTAPFCYSFRCSGTSDKGAEKLKAINDKCPDCGYRVSYKLSRMRVTSNENKMD